MKIHIVGSGLAGLSAAYYLIKKCKNYNINIYEAKKIGGRCQTTHVDGLCLENGGEFIDQEHTSILKLIDDFKLELEVASSNFKPLCLDGLEPLDLDGINQDFLSLYKNIRLNNSHNKSLEQLLDSCSNQVLKKIIINMCESVFGGPAVSQSCLNFLEMVEKSYPDVDIFSIYGCKKEKYRLKHGNQSLVDALYNYLEPLVTFIQEEVKDVSTLDGKVIVATDYLNAKKLADIPELGVGKVWKINTVLPEGEYEYTDIVTTDEVLQSMWMNKNSLVTLTTCQDINKIHEHLTKLIDKVYKVKPCYHIVNTWEQGAYPYLPVNCKPIKNINNIHENIFFVGDWTSKDYCGYMNGAVETAFELVKENF